jgi:hypothetical protein
VKPFKPTRLILVLGFALATTWASSRACGQQPDTKTEESPSERSNAAERYKELTDPEQLLEKRKKAMEKAKPPFEFFRSQILPFDVLPYVKANHWNTLTLELRANLADYTGLLQTAPVRLLDMPHDIVFRRDARLIQEQQHKLGMQLMLPQVTKELMLVLTRPDAIRGEGEWLASLIKLDPHQMIVPVLSPEPGGYTTWNKFQATVPASGEKDPLSLERQRYYRLVLPQNPDKPSLLSTHPLTWTTTSHIIWDGLLPEALNIGQQQALLDWLHWGGQLIIVGGAGPSLTTLQESFLAPYLPAVPSGRNSGLAKEDLEPLANEYPEPMWPGQYAEMIEGRPDMGRATFPKYKAEPAIIAVPLKKTVLFTGLNPTEGATELRFGPKKEHLLGAEKRVGRGRLLILAVKLSDPALAAWPGLDTLVRRVVFRRPEESWDGSRQVFGMLSGRELSWVRYVGRDLGAVSVVDPNAQPSISGEVNAVPDPVAAWMDNSALPVRARKVLEKASGLTIPGADFVLKVVLAYGLALVPVNWLVCRFVFRRRELAWVLAPLMAFGFAIVVERAAAYDMGFDSACDEIDVLEIQGDYPRGHLNRFAALYSTGRVRYSIAFPDDPTALALPMNMQRALRGEESVQSVFQSTPEPALTAFPVQPRSLAMYRAEQLINLPGGLALLKKGETRTVVNNTGMELHDAVLVEVGTKRRYRLGTIAAGASAPLGEPFEPPKPKPGEPAPDDDKIDWIATDRKAMSPKEPFLEMLRSYDWGRPEDRGEWRLVGWAANPHPGQKLEPAIDRHRGFRLVVGHLTYGNAPNPATAPYFTAPEKRPDNSAAALDVNRDAVNVATTNSPIASVLTTNSAETDRP